MQTEQVNRSVKATTVREAASSGKPTAAITGFLVLQMILGFEWFWSGLAKIMMPGGFPAALPGALGDMLQNSPPWYADFLTNVVIPHATIFGYVIELSEFLIGVAFLFGPLIWFFAWDRVPRWLRSALLWVTAAAAIGGFFMAANFHIAMGNSQPWILPTSGLDESVDLDSMVAAMQLVIAIVNIVALEGLRETAKQLGRPLSQLKPAPAVQHRSLSH